MSDKQDHKRWRKEFREGVFARDKNKCVFCDIKTNLDAHHITNRHSIKNGGYVLENGITLCPEHHLKAEAYHISNGLNGYEGMYPNDLYKRINTSYDLAVKKSMELKR